MKKKKDIMKQAILSYVKGIITFSEAAKQADLTLWEMEKYLVEQGFRSSYSIEDLEDEMEDMKNLK